MLSTRRALALRRERTAAQRIPYTAHVAERVVKTALGDYLQAFRLSGASFESARRMVSRRSRMRLRTLSLRSGKCSSSQRSKSGATAHGRRRTTKPADVAPASRAAVRIAGISESVIAGMTGAHITVVGIPAAES